jgi:hypothetical protein
MIDVGAVMNMFANVQKNQVFDIRIIELNSLQVTLLEEEKDELTNSFCVCVCL